MATRRRSRAPARPGRPRGALQESVLAELRRRLMVGVFAPGESVTLRRLARDLGTSPMPIREAIRRLLAERALEVLPNRSVVVPEMSEDKFVQLTEVRQALEGMAAVQACRAAGPALARTLTGINARLRRAIEARDVRACLALNREFHFTLYGASDSRILLPLIEMLWLQAGPFMFYSLSAPGVQWNASYHRDVIRGLSRRDPAAVRRAIERDIATTLRHLKAADVFARWARDGATHGRWSATDGLPAPGDVAGRNGWRLARNGPRS